MDCKNCKWQHPETCRVCKQEERARQVNDLALQVGDAMLVKLNRR
jgi:recombinational DNA repair protein RecR